MRRASCLFLAAAAMLSIAAPSRAIAQSKDDLTKFQNRETAVWESVKNKELASIRKVFDRNFVSVYDAGIFDLTEELDGMSKVMLRSYRLSDFKLHRIDSQNMIVSYKAVVDGEMSGQSISGNYNALTVWHRSGNRWSVSAHTEVKAR